MLLDDGRVVSNFISQALKNEKLTVKISIFKLFLYLNPFFFLKRFMAMVSKLVHFNL